jgi:fumarylacetoacetase
MMGSGTQVLQKRLCYELTWGGKINSSLNDGTERKFINDNDTVIMKGSVKMDRYALFERFF